MGDDPNRLAPALAGDLRRLGTGDLAALRRLEDSTASPAFWRLAARHAPLTAHPEAWAPILRALAILTPKGPPEERSDLHDPKRSFGVALCDGGDPNWPGDGSPRPLVSERRLAQLMAARGPQRTTLMVRAVRALAARRDPRTGVNTGDLAWAFLNPANAGAIAGPYYRRLDAAQRRAGAEPKDEIINA